MAKPVANQSNDGKAIGAINASLRGPVVDAIQHCIPELQGLGREDLYERVMNTPELAALCFKMFRANPAQFDAVLIGADGRRVTDDNQPLNCGRTLAQIITLIVRAVARRYFRATIDGKPSRQFAARSEMPTFARRLAKYLVVLRPARSNGRATRRPATPSIGDQVYRALYDVLLFEWQAQLIPEYARIPLDIARKIAPRLLMARDAEAVRALAVAPAPEPVGIASIFTGDDRPHPDPATTADGQPWQP